MKFTFSNVNQEVIMLDSKISVNKTVSTNQEILEIIKSLLWSWSGLSIQRILPGEYLIQSMTREIGLMFFEPESGILVIRGSLNIEKLMEKAASVIKPRESKLGFLKEIVVLFWSDFVKKNWNLDSRKIRKPLFKNSVPENWPKRKPNGHLTMLVESEILEIRIWTPLSQVEVENWTKAPKDLNYFNLKKLF